MKRRIAALLAVPTLALWSAIGCNDATTSPSAPHASAASSPRQSLLGLQLVAPVQRTTALASDVTWSFTAGPYGAVSRNSAVGLTVSIPYGALSSTETITVTALAGRAVAYSFSPHLEFARSVTLKQNLSGLNTGLLGSLVPSLVLQGAHFDGDTPELNADGLAQVTETVPALLSLSLLSNSASWKVGHFTGWILASGRDDGDPLP